LVFVPINVQKEIGSTKGRIAEVDRGRCRTRRFVPGREIEGDTCTFQDIYKKRQKKENDTLLGQFEYLMSRESSREWDESPNQRDRDPAPSGKKHRVKRTRLKENYDANEVGKVPKKFQRCEGTYRNRGRKISQTTKRG